MTFLLCYQPLWVVLGVVWVLQGCGIKGPPLAPLVIVPPQVSDISANRLGEAIHVQFTIPMKVTDDAESADVARIELYGLTLHPLVTGLAEEEFLETGTLVASLDVRLPPNDEASVDGGEQDELIPEFSDARPGQGEVVHIVESVVPSLLTSPLPSELNETLVVEQDEGEQGLVRLGVPSIVVAVEPQLRRAYLAIGFSRKGRRGLSSARAVVPLFEAPQPPSVLSLRQTELGIQIVWESPEGARRFVQEAAPEGMLEARPIVSWPPGSRYNVYHAHPGLESSEKLPVPLNTMPLQQSPYLDAGVEFNIERCYTLRTVDTISGFDIQSDPSSAVCLVPKDIFPPAAPNGLIAVANDGAISLSWSANTEADFAGYLILRGRASDETLRPLTKVLIMETTHLDTTVQPGASYFYAIVAVDTAVPSNKSEPSNPVDALAR